MTAPVRFTITSTFTGKPHALNVEVWEDQPALLAHMAVVSPEIDWDETNAAGERCAGTFTNAHGFYMADAPHDMGTIRYSRDHLDIGTIVHEVVHAAMFLYECDMLGDHSRARAHMTMKNERIAYLIDELMAQIADQLLSHGLYT